MNEDAEFIIHEEATVDSIVWNSGIITASKGSTTGQLTLETAAKKTLSYGNLVVRGDSYWNAGNFEIQSSASMEVPVDCVFTIEASAGNFSGAGALSISGTITISKPISFPKTFTSTTGALNAHHPLTLQDANFDTGFINGAGPISFTGTSILSGSLVLRTPMNNYGSMTWNRGSDAALSATLNNYGQFTTKVNINVGDNNELKIGQCSSGASFVVSQGSVVTFNSYSPTFGCDFGGAGTVVIPSSSKVTLSGAGSIGNLYPFIIRALINIFD